jgi:hypothetical protein
MATAQHKQAAIAIIGMRVDKTGPEPALVSFSYAALQFKPAIEAEMDTVFGSESKQRKGTFAIKDVEIQNLLQAFYSQGFETINGSTPTAFILARK